MQASMVLQSCQVGDSASCHMHEKMYGWMRNILSFTVYVCPILEFVLLADFSQGNLDESVPYLKHLGLAVGPETNVLLQKLWPGKKQSLTAKFCIAPSLDSATDPPSPTQQTPSSSSAFIRPPAILGGVHVAQILLRREEGPMRLMLAPVGGSLEGISRRLNPSAGQRPRDSILKASLAFA